MGHLVLISYPYPTLTLTSTLTLTLTLTRWVPERAPDAPKEVADPALRLVSTVCG